MFGITIIPYSHDRWFSSDVREALTLNEDSWWEANEIKLQAMLKNYSYLYLLLILVSCTTKNNPNSIFKDENLEYVVREALNKKSGEISIEELSSITEIDCNCCDDLSGIENLKNLKFLRITDSNLSDLKFIKDLNRVCL